MSAIIVSSWFFTSEKMYETNLMKEDHYLQIQSELEASNPACIWKMFKSLFNIKSKQKTSYSRF